MIAAAAVLASLAPDGAAQSQTAVETFRLRNGMEVIAIPDRRAPVVTHMVWYRVGSAEEPEGKSGIAHFLEHLMFKGTEEVPGTEFARIVASLGGQTNAFTSYDYTSYYQRIAKEHLPRVMEIEADRMINLVLSPEDIPPERDVVLEERRTRLENRPLSILGDKMSAALYGDHPYGRPVIGHKGEIEALEAEDALAFYRRFYAPNNAALVVAGDIDPEELLDLAWTHYGGIAANGEGPRSDRPVIAPPDGPLRIRHEDERVRQPVLQRLYLADSYRTAGLEQATAIDMLAEILGGGSTSRLYRTLVVERRLAVSAGSWATTELLDRGRLGIYAVPAEGVLLEELEAAVDDVLAELLERGATEEEMERVRRSYLASLVYGWDDQQQQAYTYGAAWTTGVEPEDVMAWPEVVRGLELKRVNESAQRYLRGENSVTGWLQSPSRP